jgi:Holliday junction resolvase RusA-like endonuclease
VVRTALEDVGLGTGDFPCFVGKKLKFEVSFYFMNVSEDVDNLLKFVLDALEMVLYSNDKFIFDIHACKARVYHMGDEETIIELKALDAA